jgi:RHS repeat-associated protein
VRTPLLVVATNQVAQHPGTGYRARYYDPVLARFISEDPIGLDGGVNPYAYVENDPINNRDPSGLECVRFSDGRKVCRLELIKVTAVGGDNGANGFSNNFGNQSARGRGGIPTVGNYPTISAQPPALRENIHITALKCGVQSANLAFAAVTDLTVLSGVGIGLKAAVRGGATALELGGAVLGRWASEELSARFLYGAPEHATMRAISKSGANVGFGMSVSGGSSMVSDEGPSLGGFLRGFVPGLNTRDAYRQAKSTCGSN